MAYDFRIYRALFGGTLKGYVYAKDEAQARKVWNEMAGVTTYYDVDNEAALTDTHQANEFEEIEDAEFYATTPEEGGYIIFLAPSELVEHIVDKEHIKEPHVFFVNELEDVH